MTGAHRRILVVEDDPETAGQLVEELTTSGYDVDLTANGREALSQGRRVTKVVAATVLAQLAEQSYDGDDRHPPVASET